MVRILPRQWRYPRNVVHRKKEKRVLQASEDEHGRQRGRRSQRCGSHSSTVHDGLPNERVTPAGRPLWLSSLSFGSGTEKNRLYKV